jgi:dTDP-4-dehydrorhamnose reductase
MNILITGGSGLFAVNSAIELRGVHKITLGLHKKNINLKGIDAEFIDFQTADSISSLFEKVRPDVVIHAAGITSVELCETNPKAAHHVNVELAIKIAEACKSFNVKLVYISTDHLFSGNMPLVDELQAHDPKNVYAKTKSEAESTILKVDGSAIAVRTNFYGWGTTYRKSFSDFIINELRNKRTISLFKDVYYTPILIFSLINTIMTLIELDAKGIFNVVSNRRLSKYEFGIKLANKFNLDTSLIEKGRLNDNLKLVDRPHDMSLSNEKLKGIIDEGDFNIEDDLMKLYEQEKNNLVREIISL